MLLSRFEITEDSLLGEGVESRVYALDAERVIRLPKTYKPEEMQERQEFLGIVNRGDYGFAVPEVLEVGEEDGQLFAVERRLSGRSMREIFPSLSGAKRRKAMENFLLAIEGLSSADVDDFPFGELTGKDKMQDVSWPDYLRRQADRVLIETREKLAAAVSGLDIMVDRFREGLQELEIYSDKRLVHGDYYPAHVMMDDRLKVTGLLDFSRLTVIGDPDLDRAEALSTFEDPTREGATSEDAEYFRALLMEKYGASIIPRLRTYQLYYAQLFSGCEEYDRTTYAWCLKILRQELWQL